MLFKIITITLSLIAQPILGRSVLFPIKKISHVMEDVSGDLRIIGGQVARAGEFPWQAAIYVSGLTSQTFCGGALLSNQWLVTSGHCADDALSFAVHLGMIHRSDDRVVVTTTLKYIHADYNPETLENDISMLKFHLPVTLTEYIQPLAFIEGNVADGTTVTIAGWGQTNASVAVIVNDLQYVDLVTISNTECQNVYGNAIKESMLCAVGNYNEGFCTGDSGTALTATDNLGNPYLVGIASFLSYNGCETTDPTGYARASVFFEWISNMMSSEKH